MRNKKHDLKRLDLSIGNWRNLGLHAASRGEDRKMVEQYAADVDDLMAFRDAYAAGNLDEARRLADEMDTIVRDQIPLQLYYRLFPNR